MSKLSQPPLLLCALLACAIAMAQNAMKTDFDPGHQRPVSLVTAGLSAEIVAQAPDPSTGSSRSIVLTTPAGKATVPLPLDFEQVDAIHAGPASRLVIVGRPTGSVYEVAILDAVAGKLIDTFECYEPAVSPDGNFVAFTKFFLPHSSPSPEDHSMIYSVARSAAENRPNNVPSSDKIDVGFAVYPWGIATTANNMDVPGNLAHNVARGYFWRDSQYFFGDRTAAKLEIIWVAIGDETATVRSLILPPAARDSAAELTAVDLEGETLKLTLSTAQSIVRLPDFLRLGSIDLRQRPVGAPQ